jgi:hypothetical protein
VAHIDFETSPTPLVLTTGIFASLHAPPPDHASANGKSANVLKGSNGSINKNGNNKACCSSDLLFNDSLDKQGKVPIGEISVASSTHKGSLGHSLGTLRSEKVDEIAGPKHFGFEIYAHKGGHDLSFNK